jgi:hypothetical protein
MDPMVVMRTDRDEVVEVSSASRLPLNEVMYLAASDRHLASRDGAGCVHGLDRSPLSSCRKSTGATDGDRHGPAGDEHGDQVADARSLTCCVDVDCRSVGAFAHRVRVSAAHQGVGVDDDRD